MTWFAVLVVILGIVQAACVGILVHKVLRWTNRTTPPAQ